MPRRIKVPTALSRLASPGAMIGLFLIVMTCCVLGLIAWKSLEARRSTLMRAEMEIRNLTHSMAQHAVNTFKAIDVATAGMANLLRYQTPVPARFNSFLDDTVRSLPQLVDIGVLDSSGNVTYWSESQLRQKRTAPLPTFAYHRDNADQAIRISGPLPSASLGKPVVLLTKRITREDGSFGGVIVAEVDIQFFTSFYKTLRLGAQGGVNLMDASGVVLAHSDTRNIGRNVSNLELFTTYLLQSADGYYKIVSPFDGVTKYFAYEQVPGYKTVSVVALSEGELLANWRSDLQSDLIVAAVMFCIVCFLATVLSVQSQYRNRIEKSLRDREQRYRLLADHIADIVIRLDRHGQFLFVSQSVQSVLGWKPEQLTGTSCFDMMHPDDVEAVKQATARLRETNTTQTLRFRTYRSDQSICWMEIVFRLALSDDRAGKAEIVGVLRDIAERKAVEDELTAVNARLAQLATTDGLTGLANRRCLDGFLNRACAAGEPISVLLFDIDNFKGFNDRFGHQAGDECLKRVANVIASATHTPTFLAARYGGEEFAVVLPGIAEQHAFIIAESVRLKVKALNIANPASGSGHVTVSCGVAARTERTRGEADLVADADIALYQAKRAGRDRSVAASTLKRDFDEAKLSPSQTASGIKAAI